MSSTSRELVHQTLNFESPSRVPRDLWALPIAQKQYAEEYDALNRDFPLDMTYVSGGRSEEPTTKGNKVTVGEYVDEWGCTFLNIQDGIMGEVRDPLVRDWTEDVGKIHIPREFLSINIDTIDRNCAATDLFTLAGFGAEPFQRLQFVRGTENLYMDLTDPPEGMLSFMKTMHAFYVEGYERWCRSDVDGIFVLDDWGSQKALLVSPHLWRELFKPMYRDYVSIAHAADKRVFMHSDGNILEILPDLIEIGVDAVNAQIFCMGLGCLRPYAGRVTFWGEIDRQRLLCDGTRAEIDQAVRQVHAALWRQGGCIAQCEFGANVRPENVRQVYESWARVLHA